MKHYTTEQLEKALKCPNCGVGAKRSVYGGLDIVFVECIGVKQTTTLVACSSGYGEMVVPIRPPIVKVEPCGWSQGTDNIQGIPGGYVSDVARYESTTLTQESSTTYEPTKNHLGKPRGSGVFLIDYLAEVTIEEAIA